jgi:hypothetical protein
MLGKLFFSFNQKGNGSGLELDYLLHGVHLPFKEFIPYTYILHLRELLDTCLLFLFTYSALDTSALGNFLFIVWFKKFNFKGIKTVSRGRHLHKNRARQKRYYYSDNR